MTELPRPLSWPAARRNGAVVIQHPAWEEARNAVLDLAAEGPVTVFLTGEPGSGKTWLLRELATSLGEHGFPTVALLRGDLPIPLGDGVAVLVDEASYMPDGTRAELVSQDRGVVVLADIEPFVAPPGDGDPVPVQIHLRLLTDDEIDLFVTEWLHQAGLSSAILDPHGLLRLAEHSGGAVRLITQLLTAATALARDESASLYLTGDLIDQVAAFRLGAPMPDLTTSMSAPLSAAPRIPAPPAAATILHLVPPAAPRLLPTIPAPAPVIVTPSAAKPSRRNTYRRALVGSALAASVIVASGSRRDAPSGPAISQPPLQSAQIAAPDTAASASPIVTAERATPEPTVPTPVPLDAATAIDSAPALPPLQVATIPAPIAVADAPPALAAQSPAPSLASASTQAATPRTAVPAPAATAPIAVAAIPPPTLVPVISSGVVAPIPAVLRPAATGLILVAQRGDTLERLYADIYRDRHAPPFAAVLAVNPAPFKPGAVVVFPAPIGGWGRVQR